LLDEEKLKQQRLQDQERIDTVVKAANGVITQSSAADILGILPRQVRRLVRKYRLEGPEAILHQGRGKPSNHRTDDDLRVEVLEIISAKFIDSGPTLISDELMDLCDITVSSETIRRWMMQAGLWTPSSPNKVDHRRWRERKACYGEMVQMDTSEHEWFGPEGGKQYCIAMIDDATSKLHLRFYDADSTRTNMDLIKRYLRLYGRPMSLYIDRASHFTDNPPKGSKRASRAIESGPVTQIQRAMVELGIRMIYAHSPQAKGRVERLFETLQDRLLKMMKHRDINSIEEANNFVVVKFLPYWDKNLTHQPMNDTNVHRSVEGYNLDAILSVQESRVVTNDYTFQYKGWRYQIESKDMEPKMRRGNLVIEDRLDGSIKARFYDKYIHFHIVEQIIR
jgi:transposase